MSTWIPRSRRVREPKENREPAPAPAATRGGEATHREKVEAVKELLQLFQLERMVYLSVTILSVLVLLVCAVALLWKKEAQLPEIVGLFGSSGGITYSTGRLLRMWSDAIRMLQPHAASETDK